MKFNRLLVLFAALAIAVSGCSSSNEDPAPTVPGTQPGSPQPGGTVEPGPGEGDEGGVGDPNAGNIGAALDGLLQDTWEESTPVRYRDTIVYGECSFFPSSSGWDYTGGSVTIDIEPVYEAFLLTEEQFAEKIAEGAITFAAYQPDGTIETETTANGYGFWFDGEGYVTRHGSNSVIAVETSDFIGYSVMQYPGAVEEEHNYVVSLALLYEVEGVQYKAIVRLTAKVLGVVSADDFTVEGTVTQNIDISKAAGYDGGSFSINAGEVCAILDVTENDFFNRLGRTTDIVPLNYDGSEGENTASGDYGAWFDNMGTTAWGNGDLTFIEIDSSAPFLYGTGCHESHVNVGDKVTMRLQYRDMTSLKACNVEIKASIVD